VVASAGRSAPARWVLAQTAEYLGAGIANLVNLVDPDCVVIGGWAVRLSRLRPDAVARSAAALAATELTAAELTASTDRSLAATSPR
jgi:predicted NBD/HSP70 family sugar kinase